MQSCAALHHASLLWQTKRMERIGIVLIVLYLTTVLPFTCGKEAPRQFIVGGTREKQSRVIEWQAAIISNGASATVISQPLGQKY